jgi:hypothetical protein
MRKMLFGGAAAVLMIAILAFSAAPVSAGATKPCWSHEDTDPFLADGLTPNPNLGQLVAVWATGGGHNKHAGDILRGNTDTYALCVAAQ